MAAEDEKENIDRHIDGYFNNLNSGEPGGFVFSTQLYKGDGRDGIERKHPGKPVNVVYVVGVFKDVGQRGADDVNEQQKGKRGGDDKIEHG